MELISVIVPVYNAEKTIEKCVNSILSGTYKEIEVVIVNDGSTDNTELLLSNYAQRDSRVRVINQENTGVAGARNMGLRNATGKYIAWCDADDWVEPDWLETSYKYLIEYNADVAVCRCQVDGRDSVNTGKVEIWDRDMAIWKFLGHRDLNGSLCNKLFRRAVVEGVTFENNLSFFEDDKFFWATLNSINRVVRYHEEKYHITISRNGLTGSACNEKRVRAVRVWKEIADQCEDILPIYEDASHGSVSISMLHTASGDVSSGLSGYCC